MLKRRDRSQDPALGASAQRLQRLPQESHCCPPVGLGMSLASSAKRRTCEPTGALVITAPEAHRARRKHRPLPVCAPASAHHRAADRKQPGHDQITQFDRPHSRLRTFPWGLARGVGVSVPLALVGRRRGVRVVRRACCRRALDGGGRANNRVVKIVDDSLDAARGVFPDKLQRLGVTAARNAGWILADRPCRAPQRNRLQRAVRHPAPARPPARAHTHKRHTLKFGPAPTASRACISVVAARATGHGVHGQSATRRGSSL